MHSFFFRAKDGGGGGHAIINLGIAPGELFYKKFRSQHNLENVNVISKCSLIYFPHVSFMCL